jgi:hypothetical protein
MMAFLDKDRILVLEKNDGTVKMIENGNQGNGGPGRNGAEDDEEEEFD